jgi:hypothetical protein
MEPSKPRRPFTWEESLKHQEHVAMNACVLSSPLAQFRHNEQKAIVRAKRHITLEWDRLQVDLHYTPEVLRPTFVKLTSSHTLQLLGMITRGLGAIPFNVQAKLKCDENLALVIQVT